MILGYGCQQAIGPRFLRFLSIPIERGGLFGVVGNGRQQLQARKMANQNGVVLASWFRGVNVSYLEKCESMRLVYFQCPTCDQVI
jgi:tartrate dehydratase beta subunit/fumarate hydratase class I family protein